VAIRIFLLGCSFTECRGIVTRVYEGLRLSGHSDRDAFASAVRVLELRHPGQRPDRKKVS
jgi:hypothetical protein